MKKSILVSVLCLSLASTQTSAGTAPMPSSSNSDGAVILLVVALGALLFGVTRDRGRAASTTKKSKSQF